MSIDRAVALDAHLLASPAHVAGLLWRRFAGAACFAAMANPTPRVSLVASVSGRVGAAGSAPKVAPGPPIVTPSTRPVVATAAAPAGSITAEDWLRRSAKPAVGGGDGNAGGGAVSGGGGGGVDMLVHVVSHKDFCLSVEHDADDSACLPPFVKPTFSKFQPVAEAVLAHIDSLGTDGVHIITHPLHDGNATPKAQRADDEDEVPVGLAFGASCGAVAGCTHVAACVACVLGGRRRLPPYPSTTR